jgi:hypothetical protein
MTLSPSSPPRRPGFRISARTVLELGAELISSDIIAFYELIKNAFDARSKTGVDVNFHIVLRRNNYLRLRARAVAAAALAVVNDPAEPPPAAVTVADLLNEMAALLERGAGTQRIEAFVASVSSATDVEGFIARFDEAYRAQNTIEVADRGTGMSLDDLRENYLVIGTPSRKRDVDRAIEYEIGDAPFLGEKGIGRLSAMRLGERLAVSTARSDDPHLNLLEIDWRRFYDLDAMVEDIDIEPTAGGPKPDPVWSGTTLTVGDLSEDWTESRLTAMAEYDFARLVDPFLDIKNRPRIALFWNGARISVPWMDRTLLEHAHATFKGDYTITADGPVLTCTLEALDLGFPHPR